MFPHRRRRPGEVYFAIATMGFGFWVLLPPVSMPGPAYVAMLACTSESLWGWMFLIVGLAHMLSVMVNGSRWWSPFTRAATALMLTGSFAAMALGFQATIPFATAVYTYGLATAGGLWCWYHAVKDAASQMQEWGAANDAK